MKSQQTTRKISFIFTAGFFLMMMPFTVMAAVSPSTIIPCGFDLNGDGKVLDSPSVWSSGPHEECYFEDMIILAQNVINFLIFKIASPLAAVMFAYAGFLYVTNRGNEGQVKQAHDIFLYVFWGLLVALAAWITVNFILEFFLGSGSAFNFLGS